ncbi:hypothetical protein B0H19DRAFT_1181799 [Mycena capillaripes]|nr:hypothetical protein B0H19DRAFT_1181799 [Mycena capillaripes]
MKARRLPSLSLLPLRQTSIPDAPSSQVSEHLALLKMYVLMILAVNFVTVAVRRSLRGHHPCPKPSTPNFRMFSDMPMDLVFEILPYLHPLDLFHFSRVTKQFRTLLHSKDADLLWRDVFSAEDDLPRCPPLMSTRHWVDFLFGAHVCEVCGGPGAVVDFDIWRRVCRLCIPRNVVKRIRGYDEYHELYSLMLCVGAGRTYITARDMRGLEFDSFWLADGLYVGQRYESLQEQGTEALDEFVRFRENLISESRQLCDICDRWKTHVRQQARDNYSQKLAKIFDEVRKRLLAEDIHPHDVELATHRGYNLFSSSPHLYLRTRLTSKLWRIVRPQFLIWVTEEQSARLERERSGLCDRRRRVVTAAAYTAIRGTASHVRYPPPYGYDLWAFMPFARVIYEDSNKEIFYESRPLSGEMFAFSTTMDAWNARTRADLAALLPRTTKRMHPDLMDRATSVFTCDAGCDNPTAIAWGEVRAHLGWCTKPSDMCFSPIGYWAARRLVELLGMDPQTTTDDDMDEADARFVCENCPVEQPDRLPGREVLRWRECVQHAVSCYYRHYTTYQTTHRAPRWALLSEMAAEDVCRRELRCDVGDDISLQAWACLLCQEHLPQSHDTYDEVVKHVRWECVHIIIVRLCL